MKPLNVLTSFQLTVCTTVFHRSDLNFWTSVVASKVTSPDPSTAPEPCPPCQRTGSVSVFTSWSLWTNHKSTWLLCLFQDLLTAGANVTDHCDRTAHHGPQVWKQEWSLSYKPECVLHIFAWVYFWINSLLIGRCLCCFEFDVTQVLPTVRGSPI